jgi:aryl-alcohol dehydrogenase-like predicted oxidoreductase
MTHLAMAFAIAHPGVTSAIIGPRTIEQLESQLPAGDLVLSAEVLDRIDEIGAPGRTIKASDASILNPALQAANRRR